MGVCRQWGGKQRETGYGSDGSHAEQGGDVSHGCILLVCLAQRV
jgi:hypothetical protein